MSDLQSGEVRNAKYANHAKWQNGSCIDVGFRILGGVRVVRPRRRAWVAEAKSYHVNLDVTAPALPSNLRHIGMRNV